MVSRGRTLRRGVEWIDGGKEKQTEERNVE